MILETGYRKRKIITKHLVQLTADIQKSERHFVPGDFKVTM